MAMEGYTSATSVLINVIKKIDLRSILTEFTAKRKTLNAINVNSLQAGEEVGYRISKLL